MVQRKGNKNSNNQQPQNGNQKGKSKGNKAQNKKEAPQNELIGREPWIVTPPNLSLLDQLLNFYPLRCDLWLACIRSLNGRFTVKRLLVRDQKDFFTRPIMPRGPGGRNESDANFTAIDCEMIQTRQSGNYPARVALVSYYGKKLLNVFIKPDSKVINWRTRQSGMSSEVYKKARDAGNVVERWEAVDMIYEILEKSNSYLVGHNIISDLRALELYNFPSNECVDTQKLPRFNQECGGNGLKRLMESYFNIPIQFQVRGHDPLEDARASMVLFRASQREFHEANNLSFEY